MKSFSYIVAAFGMCLMISCSKSASDAVAGAAQDSSASGAAASSIGGALGGSSSSGSPSLYEHRVGIASTACPTLAVPGSACANVGSVAELTYGACSFGTSAATWSGTLAVLLTNGTAVTCGTFPSPTGTSIQRQFVNASHSPSTGTRTSAAGTAVTIDHSTANLGNYQGDVISAYSGGGYGTQVHFNGSGVRDQVIINQRIYATGSFDHSVTGTLNVTEAGSGASKTWTISSGSVTTYHNLAKVKGTTSFSNVIYSPSCCTPTAGTITTALTSTSASGAIGNALNGKSETLTITGCGTGTLVDTNGTSTSVALGHCF